MESATTAGTTLTESRKASYQAFRLLQAGFVAAPILAGLDKFTNLLVDWTVYVAPVIGDIIDPSTFMVIVGIIEIVAGIGILLRPKIFAWVVCGWLVGIILNLLMIPGFYDVALRDLGLAIGAAALGKLAAEHG